MKKSSGLSYVPRAHIKSAGSFPSGVLYGHAVALPGTL